MRGLKFSRRVVGAGATVAALAAVVGGALFAHSASANPSPYVAHPVTAKPIYQLAQRTAVQPNARFGCQSRPLDGSRGPRCYDPSQIRTAYNIQSLLNGGTDGTGRTIVIVDAFGSPTIQDDLAIFDRQFGLPSTTLNIIAPDGTVPFDINDGNQVGWTGEIALDVEWAHAVAPGATIDLVIAKTNNDSDILSATKYVVDNNLGDVISQSFGEAESCVDPALLRDENQLFKQATAKKITLIASAGDQGAAQPTCDGSSFILSASTPASDPNVLGVGGTQLNADSLTGAYNGEVVWNEVDTFGAAGGGGFSSVYNRPGYQSHEVSSSKTRGVPDVAYNAAINGGVLTHWGVGLETRGLPATFPAFFIFGGTSAGSPQWAGVTALANQAAGTRLGFLNTRIYHLGRGANAGSLFHDITVGNNSFSDGVVTIQGFNAGPGWDATTGVGSPNVANLVPALIADDGSDN